MGYGYEFGTVIMANHWELNAKLRQAGSVGAAKRRALSETPAGPSEHGAILGTDDECKCGARFASYRELRQHGLAAVAPVAEPPQAITAEAAA